MSDVIFEDTYMHVLTHSDEQVAVQTGRPPEDATPTIVDAADLRDALSGHLEGIGDA